jgi:pyrimidine operon attenuation protein / uracil phosphoribosyltransferase
MDAPEAGDTPARTVLDQQDISRAITRITHEILEKNRDPHELLLLGIPTRGVQIAERIAAKINEVESASLGAGALDITMYRDDLRMKAPRSLEHTSIPGDTIDNKVVVLVDDVLMSGRTIRAALDALGDLGRPRSVQLAVLVDRGHRELPIRADYVGKNLPTSKTEKVKVRLLEVDDVPDQVAIS